MPIGSVSPSYELGMTYTSSRSLPVDGNVFPTGRNDIGIPGTSADLYILIVYFCLFTVYVTVFRLGG